METSKVLKIAQVGLLIAGAVVSTASALLDNKMQNDEITKQVEKQVKDMLNNIEAD